MSQALTRRSLAAFVPAAVVAAALPAGAAETGSRDALLLALRAPWRRTLAEHEAALDMKGVIEQAIFDREPSCPQYKDWPGTIDEYTAECQRVRDARVALGAEFGEPENEALEDATSAANVEIVDQITAIRAHTLAGIRFKIEVSEDWLHERSEIIDSIMADIMAYRDGGLDA